MDTTINRKKPGEVSMKTKVYASPDEVSAMFGLNARTLANQRCARVGIPYKKIGRKVLYKISDVEKYLESQTVLTTDAVEMKRVIMSTDKLIELNNQIPALFEKIIEDAQIGDIPEILKTLFEVTNETERNIYIEKLAKKLKIGKRAILNDLKKIGRSEKTDQNYRANFPGLIDLVEDSEGNTAFLIKEGRLFLAETSH
jgi:hypothetical protein